VKGKFAPPFVDGVPSLVPPSRFIVYGAGAIGGVIGGHLFAHGHDVVLIARGEHQRTIARSGLRVETPEGSQTLGIPAVEHPCELDLDARDVVLLAMKSQDTAASLRALASSAPGAVSVVCAQNGVDNERQALRLFSNVYGVCVMLPATHLEPGVVQANSAPTPGLLDVGRYPSGVDETARSISEGFAESSFDSRAVADVMRWKYAKLLMNLGNAIEAVCEPSPRQDELDELAQREGEACLRAAGVDYASPEEDRARRGDRLRVLPVEGRPRGGGSSWQSLARGAGAIEADYLNGEIVLLGRLHGVATPVNEVLQRLANEMAREQRPPGTVRVEEVLRLIADASGPAGSSGAP
jgi:2-dehydropantoate 2-reductase